MYVYRRVFSNHRDLFLVGFYDPGGYWHEDSATYNRDDAARRVNYLNGGSRP